MTRMTGRLGSRRMRLLVAAMAVAAGLSLVAACAGALLPSRERLGVPAVAES